MDGPNQLTSRRRTKLISEGEEAGNANSESGAAAAAAAVLVALLFLPTIPEEMTVAAAAAPLLYSFCYSWPVVVVSPSSAEPHLCPVR